MLNSKVALHAKVLQGKLAAENREVAKLENTTTKWM